MLESIFTHLPAIHNPGIKQHMAQTAPEGYASNYSALLDLIRFGFAVWTPSQMTALLFHAERSTAMGRDTDQHSERQAVDGIYSVQAMRWIRGPSGLSKTTWHRVNSELEQDDQKRPRGIIRKFRRTNRFGKQDATEYALDWTQIRAAIEHWKGNQKELAEGWWESWALSQIGRVTVPIQESHSPNLGETQVSGQSTRMPLSQIGRDSLTDSDYSQVSQSQAPRPYDDAPTAAAIAAAIEQATSERPTDRLINPILAAATRLQLPEAVVIRWIHEFTQEKRSTGYTVKAGLLKAFGAEIIGWTRQPDNKHFIESTYRARELRRAQARTVAEMKTQTKEFAGELLADVKQRRAAKGA